MHGVLPSADEAVMRASAAMARFVIDSGVALYLASESADVSAEHKLHAPTLWRSETLSALYEAARAGELSVEVVRERLAYIGALKIRLLGDAVLRRRAWEIAEQLDLETTYDAEYVALAQLQKCTLVSTDRRWLKQVGGLVPTGGVDALR
jgi:predicted nucleic acid-binding protein